MGRNLFLSTLALIAGICLGVLGALFWLDPAPPVQPAGGLLSIPSVSPSPSPNTIISPEPTSSDLPPTSRQDLVGNQALLHSAFQVTAALKNRDFQALSVHVHPTEGVVFTPYSTVDLEANLQFTASQIAGLGKDTSKYVWGISDGKGDALELTAADYLSRYVYNADYEQAPMLGVDRVIGTGNALENVSVVFPDCRFVEFYFPGISPEYNGFDWCGLKLVFSEYNGEYKLRAIIHSEWTI